jgi:hypothetical protein
MLYSFISSPFSIAEFRHKHRNVGRDYYYIVLNHIISYYIIYVWYKYGQKHRNVGPCAALHLAGVTGVILYYIILLYFFITYHVTCYIILYYIMLYYTDVVPCAALHLAGVQGVQGLPRAVRFMCVCVLYHFSHYNMLYYIVQGIEGLPRAVYHFISYHVLFKLCNAATRCIYYSVHI